MKDYSGEELRKREKQEEKSLARLVFESCQKLDDSLVLTEDKMDIFLIKETEKGDKVTASLSRRGGQVGYGNRGWAAVEFKTNVFEIRPANWVRLMPESYTSQKTKESYEKALPKKIVKVLNEVAGSLQDFRAREALKKTADESKIEAVKVALAGYAKVVRGYGSRAEVILPLSDKQYRVEQAYDGNFDVWVGTVRVSGRQLPRLLDFLDEHAMR